MYPEMNVRGSIRQFVLEDLASRKGITDFTDDEPLIDKGVIDSLGTFRLVSFFEDHFQVRIPDDEVIVDNFQTIAAMEQLVLSRMKKPAPAGAMVRGISLEQG